MKYPNALFKKVIEATMNGYSSYLYHKLNKPKFYRQKLVSLTMVIKTIKDTIYVQILPFTFEIYYPDQIKTSQSTIKTHKIRFNTSNYSCNTNKANTTKAIYRATIP